MALTITKKTSNSLGSQAAPFSGSDVISELVHLKLAVTGDIIQCGGDTPDTDKVRLPLCVGSMVPTEAVAAAAVAAVDGAGVYATVSGTTIVFTCTGTIADAEFDVTIIGRP